MGGPTLDDPDGPGYARTIVQALPKPVAVLSRDLRVLWANSSFCQTFGLGLDQARGRSLSELGGCGWDGPRLLGLLSPASGEAPSLRGLELSIALGRTEERTLALDARQLRVDGEAEAILLTMEDITERKREAAALSASEVRYRRLFEAAQDGILLLDARTGIITDANPFLEAMLGYSHDEIIGKKLWEIGPFRDVAVSRAAFQHLQREKYIRYEDLPLETKAGAMISVEFVSNVYDVDGEQIIQCNIRDITVRKRAEEELKTVYLGLEERVQERTTELARANLALRRETGERERAEARERTIVMDERTRFAREIHDTLAQGFTGIIIQLEAAEDMLLDEPEEARARVLRARALARESLAEARRSVWALRSLALESNDLAYALLQLANKLTQESGVRIGFALQGVLRPMGRSTEHHLLRIGQEALTNALEHAGASEIRVDLACHPDSLELSVEDRGRGFDPDSAECRRGLGLRGMRERAELVGGQLTIVSAPGQGTRVSVSVPMDHEEASPLGQG